MRVVQPESGLQSAVASVTKNATSRRRIVFSLQPVIERCSSPNPNFCHNIFAAVEYGLLPVVCRECSDPKACTEALTLCARFFWHLAQAVVQVQETLTGRDGRPIIDLIYKEPIAESLAALVRRVQTDGTTVTSAMRIVALDAILASLNAGLLRSTHELAVAVMQSFNATLGEAACTSDAPASRKSTHLTQKRALVKSMAILWRLRDEPGVVEALAVTDGLVLQFIERLSHFPPWAFEDAETTLTQGLTIFLNIAGSLDDFTHHSSISSILAAVARVASSSLATPSLQKLTSDVMSVLVSQEMIQLCVDGLTRVSDVEQFTRSLRLLSLVAYSDDVVWIMIKADVASTLLTTVEEVAESDPPSGVPPLSSIVGAVEMLTAMSRHCDDTLQLRFFEAVMRCLAATKCLLENEMLDDVVLLLKACCRASVELVLRNSSQRAKTLFESRSCLEIPALLQEYSTAGVFNIAAPMSRLIAVTVQALPTSFVVPEQLCDAYVQTVVRLGDASSCLSAILRLMTSNKMSSHEALSSEVLTLVVRALESFPRHEALAMTGIGLLQLVMLRPTPTDGTAPPSAPPISDSPLNSSVVDALCTLIEEPQQNTTVVAAALKALEALATEDCVTTLLKELQDTMTKQRLPQIRRALLNLCCFCQIPHLWIPHPETRSMARDIVLRALKRLLDPEMIVSIAETDKLLSHCLALLEHLAHDALATVFLEVLAVAQSQWLGGFLVKQRNTRWSESCVVTHSPNTVTRFLECLESLAAHRDPVLAFTPSQLKAGTNDLVKLLHTYSDDDAIIAAAFNVLTVLCKTVGSEMIQHIHDSGLMKIAIEDMQRLMGFAKVQASGLRLWEAALQSPNREASTAALRKAGALEVLTTILALHGDSVGVKTIVETVKDLLLDPTSVDADIGLALERLRVATENQAITEATAALQAIGKAIPDATALRQAVDNDAVSAIAKAVTQLLIESADATAKQHTPLEERVAFCSAAARCLEYFSMNKVGIASMTRSCSPQFYSVLLSNLLLSDTSKGTSSTAARLGRTSCIMATCVSDVGLVSYDTVLEAVLEYEPMLAEGIFRKGIVPKLCTSSNTFAEDPDLAKKVLELMTHFKLDALVKLPAFDLLLHRVTTALGTLPSSEKRTKRSYVEGLHAFLLANCSSGTSPKAKRRTLAMENVIADVVEKHDIVQHLLAAIDAHAMCVTDDDTVIVSKAKACLTSLAEIRGLKSKCIQTEGLNIGNLARSIRISDADIDATAFTMKLRHQEADRFEKRFMVADALVDTSPGTAPRVDVSNKALRTAVDPSSDVLSVSGNIHAVMTEIIELMERTKGKAKFGDWPVTLDGLMKRLLLFLNADIDDDVTAFSRMKPCVAALMSALSKLYIQRVVKSATVQLLSTIPTATRSMAERFWDTFESPYGACAMHDSAFKTYNDVLRESQTSCRTRDFVLGAYKTLSACLYHPALRPTKLEDMESKDYDHLLGTTMTLLVTHYVDDFDVVDVLTEFLVLVAQDAPGAELLSYRVVRPDSEAFLQQLYTIVRTYPGHGPLVARAIDLVTQCVSTTCVSSDEIEVSETLQRLIDAAEPTPEGAAAVLKLRAQLVRCRRTARVAMSLNPSALSDKAHQQLSEAMQVWNKAQEEHDLTMQQRFNGMTALTLLVEAYAETGNARALLDCNVLTELAYHASAVLDETAVASDQDKTAALTTMTRVLMRCGKADGQTLMTLRHKVVPQLLKPDRRCDASGVNIRLAEMIADIYKPDKGESYTCPSSPSLRLFLEQFCAQCDAAPEPMLSSETKASLDMLLLQLSAVPLDGPNTLRRVYTLWSSNPEAVTDIDAPLVRQNLDFVFNTMEEYAAICHTDLSSGLADEFRCGCACFRLLHRTKKGVACCLERHENTLMFMALHVQRHCELLLEVISTLQDAMILSAETAQSWILTCNQLIARPMVKALHEIAVDTVVLSPEDHETGLIAALSLTHLIACNNVGSGQHPQPERPRAARMFFNETEIMAVLTLIWDAWSSQKLTTTCLKHMIQVMRAVYNETWAEICLETGIVERLLGLIQLDVAVGGGASDMKVPYVPWSIERDVLFLLGFLASTPKLRNILGGHLMIEDVLRLLKLSLKATRDYRRRLQKERSSMSDSLRSTPRPSRKPWFGCRSTQYLSEEEEFEDIRRAQMNGCLALATMNMGHHLNIGRFIENGGVQVNLELLESAIVGPVMDDFDYDVANGAAALLCNTTFRRSDVQELYGQLGACQAVMNVIHQYNGAESIAATRCLISLMKAIANLALYPENVKTFIRHDIGKTFEYLYTSSHTLSDTVLSVSLRTLSNLEMEFTTDSMLVFSIVLEPVLEIVRQPHRTDPILFALAFDVLGALCRLPENAERFYQRNGIAAVLQQLRTVAFNEHMATYGLKLLVKLGRHLPDAFPAMVHEGAFDFIISLLRSPGVPPAVVSMALRLLLRATQHSSTTVSQFVDAGGTAALVMKLHEIVLFGQEETAYVAQESSRSISLKLKKMPLADTNNPREEREELYEDDLTTVVQFTFWVMASLLLMKSPGVVSWSSDTAATELWNFSAAETNRNRFQVNSMQALRSRLFSRSQSIWKSSNFWSKRKESDDLGTIARNLSKDNSHDTTALNAFTTKQEAACPPDSQQTLSSLDKKRQFSGLNESKKPWEQLEILPTAAGRVCYAAVKVILDRLPRKQDPSKAAATPSPVPSLTASVDFVMAALGIAAYFAAELLSECAEAFCRAEVADVVKMLLHRITKARLSPEDNVDVARLVCYLVGQLIQTRNSSLYCYLHDDAIGLGQAFYDAGKALHAQSGVGSLAVFFQLGSVRRSVLSAGDLCLVLADYFKRERHSCDDLKPVFEDIPRTLPLLLTRFDSDAYPNGVQDLSKKMKDKLRKGGSCWALVLGQGSSAKALIPHDTTDDNWNLAVVQWKSSFDLLRFEWRLHSKLLFLNSRAINRIRSVQPGVTPLAHSNPNGLRKSHCCVVTFAASTDSPCDEDCTFVFPSSLASRKFIAMLIEWKKAAMSGME